MSGRGSRSRSRSRRLRAAVVAPLAVLVAASGLVACHADDRVGSTFDTTVKTSDCGLSELARAKKPVTIVFWHTLLRTNAEWLASATDQFNRSQGEVKVVLRQQPSYQDLFTKYKAGLASGDLPDVVQMEETVVQQVIDSRSTIPVQACMDATNYDTSTFLPRALAYYASGGVQRAMPWSVSNPVLLYDKSRFRAAGLDPDKPPATLAEVRKDAEQIERTKASKHGIALKIAAYIFEFLLAKSGGTYVNHGNGRRSRATEANLTSPQSRAIWTWWDDMVKDGLALNTGADPSNIDHLLALANGSAAMSIEASSAIGPIFDVLSSGAFPGVELAAAPLPALTTGGGVPVGDGSLWLPKASSPEKRAAAWKYIEFLSAPEQQAGLAAAGGYIPIRTDATSVPVLAQKWQEQPAYKVGYDQLLAGPVDDATVGSLIGDYQAVRDAVRDGMIRMLRNNVSPDKATADAKAVADIGIQEYNDRVGA